jgi:hypothetical protein
MRYVFSEAQAERSSRKRGLPPKVELIRHQKKLKEMLEDPTTEDWRIDMMIEYIFFYMRKLGMHDEIARLKSDSNPGKIIQLGRS